MDEQSTQSSWLQRIKEESWEAELLVSAIGIFGSFQLFAFVEWLLSFFYSHLPPSQHFVGNLIIMSSFIAVSMLVTMFIVHFFMRFYWVGLVGLNSVFPDFSVEDSAYSKSYTQRMVAILPKLKDSVQRVDEQCSVMFSIAYCMMIGYTYITLFVTLYLWLFNLLDGVLPTTVLLIPPFAVVGLLLVQNIVGVIAYLERFREHEKLQTVSYWLSRAINMVTFGPLYKSFLQVTMTFGSNFKTKKHLALLFALCFVIGLAVAVFKALSSDLIHLNRSDLFADPNKVYPEYYVDQKELPDFLYAPEIASDIITNPVLKVFIPIFEHEFAFFEPLCPQHETNDDETREQQRVKELAAKLACYQSYHSLQLNGRDLNVKLKRQYHPITEQFGVLAYIDISQAKYGENTLTVHKSAGDFQRTWAINFYYSP